MSVAVKKAKESSHSHLDLKVFTFQNGGADTTQDQDPGQIMNKAHTFAPSITGANSHFAVAYAVLPENYTTLDLPGDNAKLIDIENQKEMLVKNFKIRNELMLLINNIDYTLLSQVQNHNEFEPFDAEALTADRNRLAGEFDRITTEASACMRDATHCHLATSQGPSKSLPKPLPTVSKSLVVPIFVGLHPSEAAALSKTSGVPTFDDAPGFPDDPFVGENLRNLEGGLIDQDTQVVDLHPHSDNQIVVSFQRQDAGTFLKPGSSVGLGYLLKPGVPR